MLKWPSLVMSVLTIALIQSCSNLESYPKVSSNTLVKNQETSLVQIAPEIPMNRDEAFFPLRRNPKGKIVPSYQWQECEKRIIFCIKWRTKTVYFEDLEWFLSNDWGLNKRRKP